MQPNLAGNNPANDPDKKPVKGRSRFKPNRSLYQTMAFGLNTPHFAMEAVEGDSVSVRVASDVDTFSLKAPVMSPVRMHKDYFFAPLRAVLPKNADLLITNPLTGDDIDAEQVNCGINRSELYSYMSRVMGYINDRLGDAEHAADLREADTYLLAALVADVTLLEPFASDGCLLNVLGHSVGRSIQSAVMDNGKLYYLDHFTEDLCNRLKEDIRSFTFVSNKLVFQPSSNPSWTSSSIVITVNMDMASEDAYGVTWSFRQFLEYMRQGGYVASLTIPATGGLRSTADTTRSALKYNDGVTDKVYSLTLKYGNVDKFLNLGRLAAYQLSCAQFYTEDSVDYIYSTKLWHENQFTLYQVGTQGNQAGLRSDTFYRWNGIQKQYDSISRAIVYLVLNGIQLWLSTTGYSNGTISMFANSYRLQSLASIGYIANLFGYTRSLKYRDYFCGSKTAPMAVGNVNVAVSSGQFSVVDVTKNIQIQRFLNQVNRVGRRFNEFVMGIFGTKPMPDPTEIIFLGRSMDIIGAEETQNTGAAQLTEPQTVTSKLRKNSSQFAFEGSFSEPGFLIGITHFDVVRPYENVTDRAMFHADRFDMFNPFMQQIGDQPVDQDEIDSYTISTTPFGYQLRYMEYRQAVDRCVGGFREFLPGYAFTNREGYYRNASGVFSISPDFIRSRPCEFDRFYVSLTHHSLAGYFHFIIRQDASVDASRPMEAAPSIL